MTQRMQTTELFPYVSVQGFKREILKLEFWSRVDRRSDGECWPFTGYCTPDGYGVFYVARRRKPASHVALWLAHGETVPAGMVAMHSCDNPQCVNPNHLRIGTHAENHADRDAKGRGAKGERRGWAKLTDAKVIEARSLRAEGKTFTELAARYGVDKKAIERAVKGITWSHVGVPS